MQNKNIDFIFQTLDKLYPNADTELKFWNDFQLILAVVMSAQTTDKQVNKVTENLFQKIKTPKDVIKMWLDKLTESISFFCIKTYLWIKIFLNLEKFYFYARRNLFDSIKFSYFWWKYLFIVNSVFYAALN